MANTFFISDLHFGHEEVLVYNNRPFENLKQMEEALVENWNKKIQDDDFVFVLGDLALCHFREFLPYALRLRGKKFLIRGNHDKYSEGQYLTAGFKVFHEVKIMIAGHTCRLSHFPYALPWYKKPFAYKSELRFMDRRPPRIKGETLLHGHTHTKKQITAPGMIHVGVDAWKFMPVPIQQIESLLNKMHR